MNWLAVAAAVFFSCLLAGALLAWTIREQTERVRRKEHQREQASASLPSNGDRGPL